MVDKNNKVVSYIKNYAFSLVTAFLIAFTIFFFDPLSFYLSNSSEFWFNTEHLLPLITAVCLIAFAVISCIFLISKRLCKKKYSFVLFCVLINVGLFIQANIIPDHNGVLDGSLIDWNKINSDMIISILLWVILILFYLFFVRKDEKQIVALMKFVMVCELAIEVMTLTVLFFNNPNCDNTDCYIATDNKEYEYSNINNFIVLLLDDFDSQFFSQRIDDEVETVFSDFTFFPDTMSVYGHTDLSIPQILTGKCYYNEETYGDYLRSAYSDSELLNYLVENGWDIGIYTTSTIPSADISEEIVNWNKADLTITSKKRFVYYVYRLVAYRCVPYSFKSFFWFDPSIMNDLRSMDDLTDLGTEPYTWDNCRFHDNLKIKADDSSNGCFKFIHLKGMHGPNNHDRFLKPQDQLVDDYEMFMGNMLLISDFFDELKKNGIYDSSTIIIMADHGSSENEYGTWKQNPIFLIKGRNERHEFTISQKRVSYNDLQCIYSNLLDGDSAEESVDILSSDSPRVFLRYDYDPNELRNTDSAYVSRIKEYITYGNAEDMDALQFTGREYVH